MCYNCCLNNDIKKCVNFFAIRYGKNDRKPVYVKRQKDIIVPKGSIDCCGLNYTFDKDSLAFNYSKCGNKLDSYLNQVQIGSNKLDAGFLCEEHQKFEIVYQNYKDKSEFKNLRDNKLSKKYNYKNKFNKNFPIYEDVRYTFYLTKGYYTVTFYNDNEESFCTIYDYFNNDFINVLNNIEKIHNVYNSREIVVKLQPLLITQRYIYRTKLLTRKNFSIDVINIILDRCFFSQTFLKYFTNIVYVFLSTLEKKLVPVSVRIDFTLNISDYIFKYNVYSKNFNKFYEVLLDKYSDIENCKSSTEEQLEKVKIYRCYVEKKIEKVIKMCN